MLLMIVSYSFNEIIGWCNPRTSVMWVCIEIFKCIIALIVFTRSV